MLKLGYHTFMKEPILIDTHSHINFKAYKDDGDAVIERALGAGVWMINAGAQYSTSQRAVEYAEKYKEGVYAAVGLHPSHVAEFSEVEPPKSDFGGSTSENSESREVEIFDTGKYKKLLENPKTVAVGEIGLEYGAHISQEAKDKQKEVLMKQIELAQQSDKPIVFHCRGAYDDLIELLEMFNFGCAHCAHSCSPNLRGSMHCFVGRLSQAEKLVEMGFHIGLNGIITYARDYDKIIKKIPLERILLETDAPYLTPVPYRGKKNEPLYVKYVAEKIAEIRGISFEKIAKQTTKNARDLFGI